MCNWDTRADIDNLSGLQCLHIGYIVFKLKPLAQKHITPTCAEGLLLERSFWYSFDVTGVVCSDESSD